MPPRSFLILLTVALGVCRGLADDPAVDIGRAIFLDTDLSRPKGQGCVSCHQPTHAFADPRRVSPGAVEGREGRRNAPSLMYAALIPAMAYEDIRTAEGDEIGAWEGGLFLDGRADDLFAQVQEPFFDPKEMNLKDEPDLAQRLRKAPYAESMKSWLGDEAWQSDAAVTYHAYRALVAFLKEPLFRPFDARIDDYLAGDEKALTAAERRGLKVYEKANCALCHPLEPRDFPRALLSDFGYDNLGVPSSGSTKDPGLFDRTDDLDNLGQFRAPSLRNVALTAPYLHNGSLATLQEVMEFYNARDVEPERWGPTDYPETVNRDDMGNLELTESEVSDLVALMDAFTDRSLLASRSEKSSENETGLPLAPAGVAPASALSGHFSDWTHRLHTEFPGNRAQEVLNPKVGGTEPNAPGLR